MTLAFPAQLLALLPVMAMNSLAVGMLWPATPALVLNAMHGDVSRCAAYFAWVNGINALLDFFTNPILGSLGDRYGRRVVLLQSLGVATFCNLLVAAIPTVTAVAATKLLFGLCNISKAMGSCSSFPSDSPDPFKPCPRAQVRHAGRRARDDAFDPGSTGSRLWGLGFLY